MVFSPLSIAGALQLLVLGAKGRTYQELTQLLGYDQFATSEAIHNDFERLIGQLLASNTNFNTPEVDHFVRVANALFIQEGLSLRPEYRDVIQSIYRADTFNVDFGTPAVIGLANKWVAESTNGKVKEILNRPIDSNTKLLIASTIYFNAKWKTTFYEDMTKKRDFWLEGRDNPPVKVEMMALGGKFPHYEAPEYDCQILALPYKNSTSTMFVILPNHSSSAAVRDLHHRLSADAINQMISKMTMKTSIVFLPKMHLTSTIDIHRQISSLGVTSLFDPLAADLGLISSSAQAIQNIASGAVQSFGQGVLNAVQPITQHIHNPPDLDKFLIFSRFNEESMGQMEANQHMRQKRNTYKSVSVDGKSEDPLAMKDFILRKRIMKESKLNKKSIRHRRQILSGINPFESLRALDRLRGLNDRNPGLFANEIVHKVDLVINEKGTEGGAGTQYGQLLLPTPDPNNYYIPYFAATTVFLQKTGTNIVFRTEEPFLFFIRHEQTQLPLFYGAVFDPRSE